MSVHDRLWRPILLLLIFPLACLCGGKEENKTGFSLAGIPVIKFDSDEGASIGARLSLYYHGQGAFNPYHSLFDLQVVTTTGGKKEIFLFYDSPFLLGKKQRLTAELRFHDINNYPFYGFGAGTFHSDLSDPDAAAFLNEDFYRYRQQRVSGWINYQWNVGPFQMLGGITLVHTSPDSLAGQTLFAEQYSELSGSSGGFTNGFRAALIYDTRDFEPAPTQGIWAEALTEYYEPVVGSDYRYGRISATFRQYSSLHSRLVLAARLLASRTFGDVPFYETGFLPGTYRIEEGIGGSKSARGVLKNRAIGHQQMLLNLELRYYLFGLRLFGQQFGYSLSGFWDHGGGWSKDEPLSVKSIKSGYGAGGQVSWNRNFIISVSLARSDEVDLALYIGVGYLF